MNSNFLPYSKPDIGDEEVKNVISTIKSGWLTSGPKVNEFEDRFKKFLGDNCFAISVNSATAGLHLGLEALGVGPGDEVITTSHTFTATAEVIRYLGADPIFVDIDQSTLCINPDEIIKKISAKTKVIIPVHFGGFCAGMSQIIEISKKYSIKIMEDAAHALPSTYQGKLIGSLETDITVFSFYANKTITTGEGGMVITKNEELAKRIKLMRIHGINKDVYDRYSSKKPKWFYEVVAPGYKYNMTDIAAALGIVQLKRVFEMQKKRDQIARIYNKELKNLPLILPPHKKSEVHSWHLYVIQIKKEIGIGRNEFIDKIFEFGVGCSVHYIPLHIQPYWRKKYSLSIKDFPCSQKVYDNCISLPIYSKMSKNDAYRVVEILDRLIKNVL